MPWKDDVYDETKFHKPLEKTRSQQDIENNLLALKRCFSGDTPPPDPEPGQLWLYTPQTGDWILRQRNKDNTAWVDLFILKESESVMVGVNALLRRGEDDFLYWRTGSAGKAYVDYYDYGHSDEGVFGFNLNAIPSSFQTSRDSSYQFAIRITPYVSLNGYIILSFSQSPGITFEIVSGGTPVQNGFQVPISGTGWKDVVFNAVISSTAAVGNNVITVSGVYYGSGTYLPATTTLTIVVIESGFTIVAVPNTISMPAGGSASFDLTITSVGGFSGTVNLSHSFGSNFTLSPTSVYLNPGQSRTVSATFSCSSTVAPNIYNGSITGTSGTRQVNCPFTIVVTGVAGFYIQLSPSTLQVGAGKTGNFTLSVVPTGGFTGTVNLSVTYRPGFSFNIPSSVTIVGSSPVNVNCTVTVNSSVSPDLYNFTVTGVSGSITSYQTLSIEVVQVGFTLAVDPSSLTVPSGGSRSFVVTATPIGGFTGTITLTVGPQVSGISFSLNPIVISGPNPSSSTCTVVVSSTVGASSHSFQITGTSDSLSAQTTLNLTVEQVGFSISVSPSSVEVPLGSSINFNVTVSPIGGFTGIVNLSAQVVSGNPAALTFNIPSANITGPNAVTVTGTVTATGSTTALVNIVGTSGSKSATATLNVIVVYVGFELSCSPSSGNVTPGSSFNFTLTVTPRGGFTGQVNFSVTPVAGFTFTLPSVNVVGSSPVSVNCSVAVSSSVSPNYYTFIITGVSGTKTAQTSLALNVVQAGSFQISVSPPQVDCYVGSSANFSVTVTPSGGFTGTVNFSHNFSNLSLSIPSVNITGPNPVTVTGTVNVPSYVQPSTYYGSITGTSGTITANASFSVRAVSPSFSLSGTPTSFSGYPGQSFNISVTVTPQGPFVGTVNFGASIANVTVNIPSVNVNNSPVTVSGTVTIMTSAVIGNTYSGYIVAHSGSISATLNISATVTAPISISASPSSLQTPRLFSGTTTLTYSVTITPVPGFNGGAIPVDGYVTPHGSYFSIPQKTFNVFGSPVTKNMNVTINWSGSGPPVGNYTVTFYAQWASYTFTCTVNLEITAPYSDYVCSGGGPCNACGGE